MGHGWISHASADAGADVSPALLRSKCWPLDVFSRDLLASRDLMAHREKREREDPGVSPVLLDRLDLMERE